VRHSNREKTIIQVINKISIGGVETLTQDLHKQLIISNIESIIFELAPNEISRKLFDQKKIRIGVLIFAFTRLILRIGFLDLIKRRNCIVIYNHAECHLVGSYIPLPSILAPNSVGIMSLFQSPDIYPPKILPKAIIGFEKASGVLCYSKNVSKKWQELISAQLSYLPLGVRVGSAKGLEPKPNTKRNDRCVRLIHIGRNTPWKKPERAGIFAQEIAMMGIKVELHFVGINENSEVSKLLGNPNLEIYFHGLIKKVDQELLESDILVNLFDTSLSGESIGVAALKALTLGKIVVIESMSDTSFENLNGIFERKEILQLISNNIKYGKPLLEKIWMSENEYHSNLKTLHISTYANNLLNLAENNLLHKKFKKV